MIRNSLLQSGIWAHPAAQTFQRGRTGLSACIFFAANHCPAKKDTASISPSVWQLEERFMRRYAAARNCPLRGFPGIRIFMRDPFGIPQAGRSGSKAP
jgi:hypothetical protein